MKRYEIEIGGTLLDVMVAGDPDLDGTFEGRCNETGELLRINGWLADNIEEIKA